MISPLQEVQAPQGASPTSSHQSTPSWPQVTAAPLPPAPPDPQTPHTMSTATPGTSIRSKSFLTDFNSSKYNFYLFCKLCGAFSKVVPIVNWASPKTHITFYLFYLVFLIDFYFTIVTCAGLMTDFRMHLPFKILMSTYHSFGSITPSVQMVLRRICLAFGRERKIHTNRFDRNATQGLS